MLKKILPVAISAIVLSTSVCHGEISIDTVLNNVVITAKTDPGTYSTMIFVKDGGSLENDTDIYAMKLEKADENGNVVFNFSMPDDMGYEHVENVYDIYIKHENKDVIIYQDEVTYITVEHRNAIMSDIEKASSAEELRGLLDEPLNEKAFLSMGVKIDRYKELENKDSVCDLYFGYDGEADKIKKINKSIAVESLNNEFSTDYMTELESEFENVKYTEITDTSLKSFIDEYIGNSGEFKKIEDVYKAYSCANALYIISNTRFDKMEDNLEKYADILGISYSDEYEDYLDCDYKNDVNALLAKASGFKSTSDLLSEIKLSIKNAKPKKSSSSSSGGGGGGSHISSNKSTVSTVTVPVMEKTEYFKDIENVEWAKEAINKMAEKGYISGDEKGNFNPGNNVTREEFVKMLVTAAGMYDKNAKCDFNDIDEDAWFGSYVASAYKNGLINGISETEFGAGRLLSRQDMATICYRAIKKIGTLPEKREFTGFEDSSEIADYASEAVTELYKAEIISGTGDGLFSPQLPATRAQSAVMIYNLLVR